MTEQFDLFNDSFRSAARRRDRGMARAEGTQAAADPTWALRAYEAIVSIAKRKSSVHVDDVLETFQVAPKRPNAWGAVWMRAIRNRIIERTGLSGPCKTDPKKHAHQYPIYRSLIGEFDA